MVRRKLRIMVVSHFGTTEMRKTLTIQGMQQSKMVYPVGVTGSVGPQGITGIAGATGGGIGNHTHQISSQYYDTKSSTWNFSTLEINKCGIEMKIPDVYVQLSTDVEFNLDILHSGCNHHDIAFYAVRDGINMVLEEPGTSRLGSFDWEIGRLSLRSDFFNFRNTGNKDDTTMPVLADKKADDTKRAFHGEDRTSTDVHIQRTDALYTEIIEDLQDYVVLGLKQILSSLKDEYTKEQFDAVPYEYLELMYNIHHCEYLRELIKEHIPRKFRALQSISEEMENLYVCSVGINP